MLDVQMLHIHLVNFLWYKTLTLKNSTFARYPPPPNKLLENNKVQSMFEYFCVLRPRQALTRVFFYILDKVEVRKGWQKSVFQSDGEIGLIQLWATLSQAKQWAQSSMHWAKWKSEVANTMKLPREAGQSCFKHVPLVGVRSLNSLKMEWRDLWGKHLYIRSLI